MTIDSAYLIFNRYTLKVELLRHWTISETKWLIFEDTKRLTEVVVEVM